MQRCHITVQTSPSGSFGKVSVIVPVYNGERYLEECLESLFSQSYPDIEVIVVNDGSTDSTADILQRLVEDGNELKIVTTPNGGLSHARNIGMAAACGDYVYFLDSDDAIHPSAITILMELMSKTKADIVGSSFATSELAPIAIKNVNVEIFDPHEAMAHALYQRRMLSPAWGKIYRRQIFDDGNLFREGILYEDLDSFYRFFEKANKIVHVEEPLYFYRSTPGSLLHRWKPARLDVLDVTDRIVEYMRQNHPDLVKAAEDRRFSAHYNMLLIMMGYDVDNPAALDRCWSVILSGRRQAFLDPKVRLKNKLGALLAYGGRRIVKLFAGKD